jgi:aerobic carbon-monoxide dehydrogenase medium subunit
MKSAAFNYERPATLDEAVRLLAAADGGAKPLSGGQSLAPLMRLRLARPTLLVDVRNIPELRGIHDQGDAIAIGAAVTHSQIEDGEVPDFTGGMLRSVAGGIAYRAIRNAGTIGGSVAHADPSADWVTCLSALGAEATIVGPTGRRGVPIDRLIVSAFETGLAAAEVLVAIRVPKLSSSARWGYRKLCRKTGELAHAMSAVVIDPARSLCRVAIGAMSDRPIVVADAAPLLASPDALATLIAASGSVTDGIAARMHHAILIRAVEQARAA